MSHSKRTLNLNQSEEQLIQKRGFEAISADGKKLPSHSQTPHDDTQTLAETKYSKFAASSGQDGTLIPTAGNISNEQKTLNEEARRKNKHRFTAKLKMFDHDPQVEAMKKEAINQRKRNHGYDIEGQDMEVNNREIVSFFGFDYKYESDTDDEDKYVNKQNKRFHRMKRRQREVHVLKLWRTCQNKAFVCAIMITQFHAIHTKVSYFGRQMIGYDADILKKQRIKQKNAQNICMVIDPQSKFILFWNFLNVGLLIYNATASPFRTAFHTTQASFVLLATESISDFIFFLDIFVTFLLPYERYDSSYETNFKKIARNYIFGGLWIDILAVMPTEALELRIPDEISYMDRKNLLNKYNLYRILRLFKLLKIQKYYPMLDKQVKKMNVNSSVSRIGIIMFLALFLVHIFACIFFLAAKMNDFTTDTWVNQKGMLDASKEQSYVYSLYWAFQTLTTVGYGDFGAYNTGEIAITCVWMFLGVAFYSFVVGSLTSVITAEGSQQENLIGKLKALEEFAQETRLDIDLHSQVKTFLLNNYNELFSRVDEEALINELPPTLKEELFFHQFGSLIDNLEFLQDLENNECTWGIVKNLKKIRYEKGDKIYHDKDLSETLYLINKGHVKLYAENGFPFAAYKSGSHFGDVDMFCGIRRNGTAQATEDCQLYKIQKSQIEDVLSDFPVIKKKLTAKALADNQHLINSRLDVLKKNPIYGMKAQQKQALLNIQQISKQIKEKKSEFLNTGDGADKEKKSKKKEDEEVIEIDADEVKLKEKEQQVHTLNQMTEQQNDIAPQFTQNVLTMINGIGVRDSLDFDHQKNKALAQYTSDGKLRYGNSKKMENIKQDYLGGNKLPNIKEVEDKANQKNAAEEELKKFREQALEKLPYFQDVNDIKDLIESNPEMQDEVAENSLEALVSFNEDMKTLALNAYQMQDLLDSALEENDLILQWMNQLEGATFKAEEDIVKMSKSVEKAADAIINAA